MPCLAAIVAGRRTPASCPFDPALVSRLQKLSPFGLALLSGRDLDAELDDAHLYKLRHMLLSYRQPLLEKAPDVHLKHLSDVRIIAPDGK
jgi:hypothetical protein